MISLEGVNFWTWNEWVTEIEDWFDESKRYYELITEKQKFIERKEKVFGLRYHSLKTMWEKVNTTAVSGWERRGREDTRYSSSSISEKFILGPVAPCWVWSTGNQQRGCLQTCPCPLALVLQKSLLRDVHGLQKWKDLYQNPPLINFQCSVLQQLLPKGGWAGKQRGAQAPADPRRSRDKAAPRPSSLGQPAPPAAAWFGALSDLGTQLSFRRGVCAHTCRPACGTGSSHSTKQWRTWE